MRFGLASAFVAVVLMATAACGVDVPVGLADKVNSGCPDMMKPEPVAVITRGFVVSQVESEVADNFMVSLQDGCDVLLVSLIAHPSQEVAKRLTGMFCPSGVLDESGKSCTAFEADSGKFALHGVAGGGRCGSRSTRFL